MSMIKRSLTSEGFTEATKPFIFHHSTAALNKEKDKLCITTYHIYNCTIPKYAKYVDKYEKSVRLYIFIYTYIYTYVLYIHIYIHMFLIYILLRKSYNELIMLQ